jgi:endonuclease/exonuclease/phosphatase family metal-dependent hydrolase
VTTIVERMVPPALEMRNAISNGPTDPESFGAIFAAMPCLEQIERVEPAVRNPHPIGAARVVFWNAERLKYLTPSITLLRSAKADALLLCEIDRGMARSGNIHTVSDLATALEAGYLFAVEFVELGLGDQRERTWHEGQSNADGLHGAGLVSARPLLNPRLVRLETTGRWFDGVFGERRVGGRMAIMAELEVRGINVLLVSVHFESHTDPDDRLAQTRSLLGAIDVYSAGLPVLIGGDFNTNTFPPIDRQSSGAIEAALVEDSDRLMNPVGYEPMFAELRRQGYDWETCNVMGATTQRTRPDGTPRPPLGRIDWFFARGLVCSDPAIIAAVDDMGIAISDHEALAVTIRPSGS